MKKNSSGLLSGDDELDGARTRVVDAAGGVACGGSDAGPGGRIQQRRRRLFDDLLVAALQAALTLAEVDDVAVAVGEHLHLDVPGHQHEPLEEQRVVAERRGRFAARGDEGSREVGGSLDHAHALAAPTGGRFDEHGIADLGRRRRSGRRR